MHAPFDQVAGQYDDAFTNSLVGRAQRDVVWKYLNKHLSNHPLRILELNCGTGEDATWLAKKGHHVVATDISNNMLEAARNKAAKENTPVTFRQWDLTQPSPLPEEQFDIIFSNFGGLNCLSITQIEILFHNLQQLISPTGKVIFVVMGKFCLWESIYFFCTGRFRQIFRRMQEQGHPANLDNRSTITTHYHSLRQLTRSSKGIFRHTKHIPVGIFIPPSYLNPRMTKHKLLFTICRTMENFCTSISICAYASDHYLIEFVKR